MSEEKKMFFIYLDLDADQDPKVDYLITEHGIIAYSFFVLTIQMMGRAKSDNYGLNINNKVTFNAIKKRFRIHDNEQIKKFFKDCIDIELFEEDESGFIYSKRLCSHFNKVGTIAEKRKAAQEIRWEKAKKEKEEKNKITEINKEEAPKVNAKDLEGTKLASDYKDVMEFFYTFCESDDFGNSEFTMQLIQKWINKHGLEKVKFAFENYYHFLEDQDKKGFNLIQGKSYFNKIMNTDAKFPKDFNSKNEKLKIELEEQKIDDKKSFIKELNNIWGVIGDHKEDELIGKILNSNPGDEKILKTIDKYPVNKVIEFINNYINKNKSILNFYAQLEKFKNQDIFNKTIVELFGEKNVSKY